MLRYKAYSENWTKEHKCPTYPTLIGIEKVWNTIAQVCLFGKWNFSTVCLGLINSFHEFWNVFLKFLQYSDIRLSGALEHRNNKQLFFCWVYIVVRPQTAYKIWMYPSWVHPPACGLLLQSFNSGNFPHFAIFVTLSSMRTYQVSIAWQAILFGKVKLYFRNCSFGILFLWTKMIRN